MLELFECLFKIVLICKIYSHVITPKRLKKEYKHEILMTSFCTCFNQHQPSKFFGGRRCRNISTFYPTVQVSLRKEILISKSICDNLKVLRRIIFIRTKESFGISKDRCFNTISGIHVLYLHFSLE